MDQPTTLLQNLATPPRAPRYRRFELRMPEGLRRWWDTQMSGGRRERTVRRLKIGAGVACLGAAIGLYFLLRPVPQPDYLDDPIDEVFNYTLLTDEFNNLPVEKRMQLIGELVKRLKSMSGNDSVLMAAFASGIAGAARDQIERNASRLAIDMWDKYAKDYDKVPADKRGDFLEQTFIDFTKSMEAAAGQPRDISDADRINEVRRQATRDRQSLRDNPERQPPAAVLGRMFQFMNNNVGGHANPQQRQRGQQLMRDMTRHFRGQDVSTGKPLNGPG